jgi:type III restriction enzyme
MERIGGQAMATAASWITRRTHPDGVEACIRDTNINVWGLVQRRQSGMEDEDILTDVQGLTPEDLQAAWEYFESHKDEVERAIRLNIEA